MISHTNVQFMYISHFLSPSSATDVATDILTLSVLFLAWPAVSTAGRAAWPLDNADYDDSPPDSTPPSHWCAPGIRNQVLA